MSQLAIAGCGWLGLALAQRLAAKGWQVSGSSRNRDTLAQLTQAGISNSYLDIGTSVECAEPQRLFQGDTLLINLPPGRHQQDNDYHQRILLLAQAAKAQGITQALFVSSTAVYQDQADCRAVDEQSPLADSPRAQTMLQAETVIKSQFERWQILRPGGLVGGERHPGRFLAGKTDVAGGNAPVNMVHRDDLLAAIELLLTQPQWGKALNVVAPLGVSRAEFYPMAALALGLPAPSFSHQDQPGKRVVAAALTELGFTFERETAAALLATT
ncbi:NAD(P)H-binding protein [uncultured Ferrimonas sp.]|uniref:NAD(P)H-binding protein n=1 Tax=uncultured Ferrimonas sp. TaxID=432640 RepID=UPI0026329163|nr:NAD(P)H-binding protein [uncultured Ferrimonas sp.]